MYVCMYVRIHARMYEYMHACVYVGMGCYGCTEGFAPRQSRKATETNARQAGS